MTITIRDVTGEKLTKLDLEYSSKRASTGEFVGRFIADVKNNRLYVIPEDIDHPEFVTLLTGKTKSQMKEDPLNYNQFVGISISVQDDIIERILVGITGFEFVMVDAMKARAGSKAAIKYHTQEQLMKARNIAFDFVIDSEMQMSKSFKVQLVEAI